MLLDHNFNMTNVFDILFYWVSQSEECNQNLQNLTKLAGKKYSFKTLKQKKVVFMKKYHFKAVFEKKQARTYTATYDLATYKGLAECKGQRSHSA